MLPRNSRDHLGIGLKLPSYTYREIANDAGPKRLHRNDVPSHMNRDDLGPREIIHSVGPGPVVDAEGNGWIDAQPDIDQLSFWSIKLSRKDARLEPIADGISVDLAIQIAERAVTFWRSASGACIGAIRGTLTIKFTRASGLGFCSALVASPCPHRKSPPRKFLPAKTGRAPSFQLKKSPRDIS